MISVYGLTGALGNAFSAKTGQHVHGVNPERRMATGAQIPHDSLKGIMAQIAENGRFGLIPRQGIARPALAAASLTDDKVG